MRRIPPTFIPEKPWSKPGIMRPKPTGKLAGCAGAVLGFPSASISGLPSAPRTGVGCWSQASKTTPSAARHPVYFTLYIFRGSASAPAPTLRSCTRSAKSVFLGARSAFFPGGYLTTAPDAAAALAGAGLAAGAEGLVVVVAGLAEL